MRRLALCALAMGCAPAARIPPPAPVPARVAPASAPEAPRPVPPAPRPGAEAAWRAGWMPLHATGVPEFAAAHPHDDGRGVLIAILDSGLDPAVPGLALLPDGRPKLLDLRDFSGEGRIPLAPVARRDDALRIGDRVLLGASRVTARAAEPFWGGTLAEVRLGPAPGGDLNGNGSATDTLAVLVARGPTGWLLFVDRHGDGSLADDVPVRDFAVAREWFGWHAADRAPTHGIAANIGDSAGTPVLDLFFDTSSHGTHVAGIAAGHALYGIPGFDGVAPGATLLGLKVANNADGGITVPGSMLAALAHAVAVARERRMPLVVNLSFGVGNEEEGAAVMDALVDSVLGANPDVVMTIAASNDGPGLSTLGLPGSATRALSVGATQPLVFTGLPPDDPTPDPVAYFSSRGGELRGPDLVAPGLAWSSVPAFDAGNEQQGGTSMAAPHAAGLAARLLSHLRRTGRWVPAATVLQALRIAARPIPGATVADQGHGVPDLPTAAAWLAAHERVPVIIASAGARNGRAAFLLEGEGTVAEVVLRRSDAAEPVSVRVAVDADWLVLEGPDVRMVDATGTVVRLRRRAAGGAGEGPGVREAAVRVTHATDEGLGTLLLLPVVHRTPLPPRGGGSVSVSARPGAVARVPFLADSGLGLRVRVGTAAPDQLAIAALHEPGGQPFRDGQVNAAGHRDGAALFEVDAEDVEAGTWELAVVAPPTAATEATVTVTAAPVRLGAAVVGDSFEVRATSVVTEAREVRLRAALTGAGFERAVGGRDATPVRVVVPVPAWATRVTVDTRMPRAAWPGFTDFGVTLRQPDGVLVEASPLTYAAGRLRAELPEALRGDSLVLVLAPAPARTGAGEWTLDVTLRFAADRPWALDGGGTPRQTLAPGASRRVRFPHAGWPLDLGGALRPLVTVVALEGDDAVWTRELMIRGAGGPTR